MANDTKERILAAALENVLPVRLRRDNYPETDGVSRPCQILDVQAFQEQVSCSFIGRKTCSLSLRRLFRLKSSLYGVGLVDCLKLVAHGYRFKPQAAASLREGRRCFQIAVIPLGIVAQQHTGSAPMLQSVLRRRKIAGAVAENKQRGRAEPHPERSENVPVEKCKAKVFLRRHEKVSEEIIGSRTALTYEGQRPAQRRQEYADEKDMYFFQPQALEQARGHQRQAREMEDVLYDERIAGILNVPERSPSASA